jgi:hypothetical protein
MCVLTAEGSFDSRQMYKTQPADYTRTDRNFSKSSKAADNIDSQLRNQAASWQREAKLSSERSSSKSGSKIYDDYDGDRYAMNDYGKVSQSPRSATSAVTRSATQDGRRDDRDVASRYQDKQYTRTDYRNDRYDFSAQPASSRDRNYQRTAADDVDYRSRSREAASLYDDFDGQSYRQGSAMSSQPTPSLRDTYKSSRDTSASAAKLDVGDEVSGYRGSSRSGLSLSQANARSGMYVGEMERKTGAYGAGDMRNDRIPSHLIDAETPYGRQRDVERSFLDRYGETFLTESERAVETPRSGMKGVKASPTNRDDVIHKSGYRSHKPDHDARSKTVSAATGADDGRLKDKRSAADKTVTTSTTAASETNKRLTEGASSKQPPLSDLKRDLLKDKAQLDQRLKTGASEKENRKLHWEDGWRRSPRDADDRLYKEKTVHVDGSSISSQHSLYIDHDDVVPDRRHPKADSATSGRDGRHSSREMREESLTGKEKSRVTINSGRDSRNYRLGDSAVYDEDSERSYGRYDHLSAVSSRDDERYSTGKTSLMRESRYTFDDVDRHGSSSSRSFVERNRSDTTVRPEQSSTSSRSDRAMSGSQTASERNRHGRDRTYEGADDFDASVRSTSTKNQQHHRRRVAEVEQTARKKPTFTRRADLSEAKYDVGEWAGGGGSACINS